MIRDTLLCFALFSSLHAADIPSQEAISRVEPPYYELKFPGSSQPGELTLPVTYTLWIPEGVKILRGVIVHQHGCGMSGGKTGLTAAYDLHWQALARKWDCALLGPAYFQQTETDCRQWCDPRNGSDKAFQKALHQFAIASNHPELAAVPWCLWGHSGGGFWSSLMLTLHPERIAAIWFRSGSAFAVWSRGEIPAPTLEPSVYAVPMMFNGGVKEAEDKRHGPARVGDRAMLKWWREHGAPAGSAPDPLTGHECGDSRYLAIAFFDACLAQRLPERSSSDQKLKPVNLEIAWYDVPGTTTAQAGAAIERNKLDAHWLPDENFARTWESYVKTGRPADTTPPPSPTHVKCSAGGEVTWSAVADFESGLGGFIVQRDGRDCARLPESPLGKHGTPLFQGLTSGDTPVSPIPPMKFMDRSAQAGQKHQYRVISVNGVGLRSEPSLPAEHP